MRERERERENSVHLLTDWKGRARDGGNETMIEREKTRERENSTAATERLFYVFCFAFACVFPLPFYVNKTERDEEIEKISVRERQRVFCFVEAAVAGNEREYERHQVFPAVLDGRRRRRKPPCCFLSRISSVFSFCGTPSCLGETRELQKKKKKKKKKKKTKKGGKEREI